MLGGRGLEGQGMGREEKGGGGEGYSNHLLILVGASRCQPPPILPAAPSPSQYGKGGRRVNLTRVT